MTYGERWGGGLGGLVGYESVRLRRWAGRGGGAGGGEGRRKREGGGGGEGKREGGGGGGGGGVVLMLVMLDYNLFCEIKVILK